MRFRRLDGPADRVESERFLDAAHARAPLGRGAEPLARLLAAAAAPADADELAGEEAALAAFRAARANPNPAPVVVPGPRHRLRVAAALAGLAATATAGVAFAAVSLDRPPTPAPAPPTVASTGASGAGTSTHSFATPPGAVPSGDASTAPTPGGSAGPGGSGKPASAGNLAGQCRAYLAKSDQQRARALQSPGFADLVTAAGGASEVERFCLTLVPDKSPKPKPPPTRKSKPKATSPAAAQESTPATPPRTGKPSPHPGR